MRPVLLIVIGCVTLLHSSASSGQRVNKCVQPNGATLYSMEPCPAGAAASTVRIVPAPSAPPAGAKGAPNSESEFQKRRLAQQEAEGKAAKEAVARREAERNCAQARGTLAELEGGRVPRLDASGQRVFLNDGEIAAEKSKARASVAEWCK